MTRTSPPPNDYFFTETYVEFNHESMSEQRFLEQGFPEDVDYDDAAIGQMLFNAYREENKSITPSEKAACLLVSRRRQGLKIERGNPPVVERGHEQNSEHAQIRTLLDRQREQILADCQAEIRKHEFQADYDRRSIQKLSETIESQQEGLHRRDQQLLHAVIEAKLEIT